MKILYHHRILSKDGQDVHIEELIAALRRQGNEVIIVGPTAHRDAQFGSEGGALTWLRRNLPQAVSELLELAYSAVTYRRLLRAWKKHRPDVLYERYNLFLLAGLWLKRRTGIPYLLEVNSPLRQERSLHGGLALQAVADWTEKLVWRHADAVLPVTHVLAGHLRSADVNESRIHVIPNGVDTRRFSAAASNAEAVRSELGFQGKLILGFVGFIRPWHRLERVLEAMAALPERRDLHFLVIGDGPGRKAVEARAAALGLGDRLTTMGLVPRDRVVHYIGTFDIAIQPHVVEYASPLKLFEYMALGRAIIAPNRSNVREVLTHDHDALLVPDAENALREAIIRLCCDQNLRRRLGTNAATTIQRGNYSWDANASRVVEIATAMK